MLLNTLAVLLLALLFVGLLILLAWYLLIKTEGVYLGWRVVVWLYDMYASRYDRIKRYDRTYETFFLARPVLACLHGQPPPLVLDVATGTARLPLTLLEQSDFHGHVIGLDLSRQMLFRAAVKLAGSGGRYDLIWHTAMDLPFPDDVFDLVTCIEAWEFLPDPPGALREMVRALRPGGTLLLTNRRGAEARLMPGRTFSREQLGPLLAAAGMIESEVQRWQVDYDLVWARKAGDSLPTGVRPLTEILRCPACDASALIPLDSGEWVCTSCEARAPVGEDGVIELFRMRG